MSVNLFRRYDDRETLERLNRWPSLKKRFKYVRIYSGQWSAYWVTTSGYTENPVLAKIWTIEEALRHTNHCGPEKKIQYVDASMSFPDSDIAVVFFNWKKLSDSQKELIRNNFSIFDEKTKDKIKTVIGDRFIELQSITDTLIPSLCGPAPLCEDVNHKVARKTHPADEVEG